MGLASLSDYDLPTFLHSVRICVIRRMKKKGATRAPSGMALVSKSDDLGSAPKILVGVENQFLVIL